MRFFGSFILLCLLFGFIERAWPLKPQRFFRSGWLTDTAHFFINVYFVQVGVIIGGALLYITLGWLIHPAFQAQVRNQPIVLQWLETIAIAELTFYWLHRLGHVNKWLWRFHAIHHSSINLDWLASVRVHPVDQILDKLAIGLPLVILGIDSTVSGTYVVLIASLQALFVHSNTRIKFGWLRWVIATPEFHHWHHAKEGPICCNLALQFPFVDWVFGTLHLPDHPPKEYGCDVTVPSSYWGQLTFPFRKQRNRLID